MAEEFKAFPKIRRWDNITATISEKIDGTNACVVFSDEGVIELVQSRKRAITPGKATDNFGFAEWVSDNRAHLFEFLGPGRHYGEWWGQGIQTSYGQDRKWFTPFNSHQFPADRWMDGDWDIGLHPLPVLWQGPLRGLWRSLGMCGVILTNDGSQLTKARHKRAEGLMIYTDIGYIKHPFDPNQKGGQ